MLRRLTRHVRVWWSLLGDERTPLLTKALPWASVLYLLMPIDVVPDILPFIGQLDDIGVLIVLLAIAFKMVPRDVWQEYEQKAHRTDVIDI